MASIGAPGVVRALTLYTLVLVHGAAEQLVTVFDPIAKNAVEPRSGIGQSRLESVEAFWRANDQSHTDLYAMDQGVVYLQYKAGSDECRGDYLFPLFHAETLLSPGARAVLYISALVYAFLGVSIIADVFMSSIEVITSTQRKVNIDGKAYTVQVWNDTVANLTLMALGSSAPEILLAVVEAAWQLGQEPEPGKGLGPGTIVGSAAFNLLFIIGICIAVIPSGQVRRIEQVPVFAVTAFFSIFAYVWMLIVLVLWTPDEVTLAEAVLTFAFFPVLVGLAYMADRTFRDTMGEPSASGDIAVMPENEKRLVGVRMEYKVEGDSSWARGSGDTATDKGRGPRQSLAWNKRDLAVMLADERGRRMHSSGDPGGSQQVPLEQSSPLSRFFKKRPRATAGRVPLSRYRIQGIRQLTGGRKVLVTDEEMARIARAQFEQVTLGDDNPKSGAQEASTEKDGGSAVKVSFSSRSYTCPENCGAIDITVVREGGLDQTVHVKYETSSGTATPGQDYVHTFGTLTFGPGVREQRFKVDIIDDDQWEPDELFFVHLRPAAMLARTPSIIPQLADTAGAPASHAHDASGQRGPKAKSRAEEEGGPGATDSGSLIVAARRASSSGIPLHSGPAGKREGPGGSGTQGHSEFAIAAGAPTEAPPVATFKSCGSAGAGATACAGGCLGAAGGGAQSAPKDADAGGKTAGAGGPGGGSGGDGTALVSPSGSHYGFVPLPPAGGNLPNSEAITIVPYDTAVVTIIDDDKPGTFEFARAHYRVEERATEVILTVQRTDGSDGQILIGYHTRDAHKGGDSEATPLAVAGSAGGGREASDEDAVSGKTADAELPPPLYKPVRQGEGFVTFRPGETEALIQIPLTQPEPGELLDTGPVSFAVELFVPDRLDGSQQGALLGSTATTVVTVTSDPEVQRVVSQVATAINAELDHFSVESGSWSEQFREAVKFECDNDANMLTAAIGYVLTVGWKVVFSLVPPTSFYMGYATFFAALVVIAVLTAAIGDITTMLGCVLGIPDSLSAITIVALGTSLPDFFASKVAAVNDEHADASVGNVTGSNSVNVFLGLGFPWLLSAIYHAAKGTKYVVYAGSLSFSVGAFAVCAVVALGVICARRSLAGGELGGPNALKHGSAALLVSLWFLYILMSALQVFDLLPWFPAS